MRRVYASAAHAAKLKAHVASLEERIANLIGEQAWSGPSYNSSSGAAWTISRVALTYSSQIFMGNHPIR